MVIHTFARDVHKVGRATREGVHTHCARTPPTEPCVRIPPPPYARARRMCTFPTLRTHVCRTCNIPPCACHARTTPISHAYCTRTAPSPHAYLSHWWRWYTH